MTIQNSRHLDETDVAHGVTLSAETILGLDNVALELPIAGIGSRVLAGFIDYLILLLLSILLTAAAIFILAYLHPGPFVSFAIIFAGLFLLDYGYFAGSEIISGGRTLGKAALGLHVATRSGGKPGASALLVRNLVRAIDIIIALPLMAFDPLSRRLGDQLAGTLVLHRATKQAIPTLRRMPTGWGARHIAVLESFLFRFGELEPSRADALAYQLISLIERDDPAFLEGIKTGTDPIGALLKATRPRNGWASGCKKPADKCTCKPARK